MRIGRIVKSPKVRIVASLMRVDGGLRADLRRFVVGRGGKEIPTRAGVNVPACKLPELRDLVDAMIKARDETPHDVDRGADNADNKRG